MKDKVMRKLLEELLRLAERSSDYKKGIQWAVNAVVTARFILGQKNKKA